MRKTAPETGDRKSRGNEMKKKFRQILCVTLITLLRIPLTILFLAETEAAVTGGGNLWSFWTVMTAGCVYASDFLDGRLARKWQAVTEKGARLDLFCDSVYILGSLGLLCVRRVLPYWLLLAVSGKLAEFLICSRMKKYKEKKGGRVYYYDRPGRILSAVYYLTPLLVVAFCRFAGAEAYSLLYGYSAALTGATVAVSWLKFKKGAKAENAFGKEILRNESSVSKSPDPA